ncbi:TOMM propeptide domain-containing protein [Lewinella sp. LCG006]|uniref:TOMM propeptide domain-containing protein n=1 Tax=Lewinella sp. LCG006 TaxID=3231911 RepID=UPI003460CF68
MNSNSQKSVSEKVVYEALNNPDFKAALIENPMEAIKSLTGQYIHLPEGKERLVVVDQTDPKAFYFNLPSHVNTDDVELTEDQLEAVAGGMDIIPIFIPTLPPCFPFPFPDGGTGPYNPYPDDSILG